MHTGLNLWLPGAHYSYEEGFCSQVFSLVSQQMPLLHSDRFILHFLMCILSVFPLEVAAIPSFSTF